MQLAGLRDEHRALLDDNKYKVRPTHTSNPNPDPVMIP